MWTDPRLAWNPERYHNMTHLYSTLDQLWFPNFHPCDSLVVSVSSIRHFSRSSVTYLAQENNQVAKVMFLSKHSRTIENWEKYSNSKMIQTQWYASNNFAKNNFSIEIFSNGNVRAVLMAEITFSCAFNVIIRLHRDT